MVAGPGLRPSWLFARTGIGAATRIPGIVGYELYERTPLTPAGTRVAGSGAVPCTSFTPEPNEPMPGPCGGLAETTIYTARSGAILFDSGTMGWELGLEPVPSASPDAPLAPDPRVVAMTRNLIARVLRHSAATGSTTYGVKTTLPTTSPSSSAENPSRASDSGSV